MKVFHHIGLRIDNEQQRAAFLAAGVELPSGVNLPRGGVITSFDIAEDDLRWETVARLFSTHKVIDTITTKFSAVELNTARFLGVIARSQQGYPEPSDGNGYLSLTFDLREFCPACGIGKKQMAPFRMRGAPKLKHDSVLQLNWVLDEYFVTSETWAAVFKPLGIGCRPVVANRTDCRIDSLVQIDIPQRFDVNVHGLTYQECSRCGRKKYRFMLKGFYREPIDANATIFKSNQYFGSGGEAFRLVTVSNQAYRKMKEFGLKGVHFYPCAQRTS